MVLDYIYHSGFGFEFNNFTIIIDFYKDAPNSVFPNGIVADYLMNRPGKLYVLSSHRHHDHFSKEILEWKKKRSDIIYIFSKDILRSHLAKDIDAIYIDKGETFEDNNITIEACGSTDIGISFLIKTQGKYLFHAGDLNNWNWCDESTPSEIEDANHAFIKELDYIYQKTHNIDLALFPVDPRQGSDYMKGAKQFIEKIKTNLFIPMHFDNEYNKANAFKEFAESKGCRFITLTHPGEQIKITI